jgi:hypothetical protein
MQHPRFMQPLPFPFSSRLPRRAVGAACDFFDLSVFLHTQPDVFNLLHKAVILSEAPRRFIAYRRILWRGVEGPRQCFLADAIRSFPATNYTEN